MTTDDLVSTLKDTLVKIGTDGVMTYLCATVPFFNLPFVNYFTKMIVEKLVTILVNETEMRAYFEYVDIFTEEQRKKFEDAAHKNEEAEKNGTDEEKKKAEQDLVDAARDLIKFNH